MASSREGGRARGEPRPPDPPRADLVEGCPPHYWIIAGGWQTCKKCDLRQEIPVPEPRRFAYPRRDASASPKPAVPPQPAPSAGAGA